MQRTRWTPIKLDTIEMIKNIIFDFGDIFIDLDKEAPYREFRALGLEDSPEYKQLLQVNLEYETGHVLTEELISAYQDVLPYASRQQIITAWNSILKTIPKPRLEFIQQLKRENKYRLFLLSNTNHLHIEEVEKRTPFYTEFKACFEKFYLSHQIQLRKPNHDIFYYVLKGNQLYPEETLFIDDTEENCVAAKQLKIHTWNLNPKVDDVRELFSKNSRLF